MTAENPVRPPASRRYLAGLAALAVAILAIGLLIRGLLRTRDEPASAAPSEAAAFEALSRQAALRRMADVFSERIAAVAPLVEYLPATGAAAVRWRANPGVLSTATESPVVAHSAPAPARTPAAARDSVRRDWILIAGRRPDGRLLSAVALDGGRIAAQCAETEVSAYLLDIPLTRELAGAGLFDLDGRQTGLVVYCRTRLLALPADEVERLLAAGATPIARLRARWGISLAPLDQRTRRYFKADSGLLVTQVRRNGPADDAGLRAGDLVVAIDGRPASAVGIVADLVAGSTADSHGVTRIRGGSPSVRILRRGGATAGSERAGVALGDDRAPAGVAVTAVRSDSPAFTAGLRAGDRLLRIGDRPVRSRAVAHRLIAPAGDLFIAFERDSVEHGVLVVR